jgi:hypothetical protein
VSAVQVDLHDVEPQVNAPHGLVVNEHVPLPLQVPAVVSTPPVHDAVLQEVVAFGYAHAVPLKPSQRAPQVVPEPVPLHIGRPPTGVPITLLHVPTEPLTLHAWHWPAHDELQQTPSTHWPEPHSEPAAHAVPFVFAHLPTEPAMLQLMPLPVHAVSQQTPDAQLPLVHALLPVHTSPLIFLATHAPPAQ